MKAKPRVVVAMSGGVDSSLTAALLVRQGYDVVGVTMRLSEESRDFQPDDKGCCTQSAVEDARRVAEIIGIPHYVMNFKDMFQHKVIDYFIDEYANGRTPNPCIACNRYVKFEGLLQRSLELDAQYVATGHYAQIIHRSDGRCFLKKGADVKKDQSYVLYHLNQQSLPHFMMPLGGMTKDETRKMAEEFNLPVAHKPESQEICFVPNDDYKAYLGKHVPAALKSGDIVNMQGKVIGHHQGVPLYTVGQRRGLGIAASEPLYVVSLDMQRNRVVVGSNSDIFTDTLVAKDLNWLTIDELTEPLQVMAKIRYGAKESPAVVYPVAEGIVKVVFAEPQRAITPGQSVVFYDDDTVVGGGSIVKSVYKNKRV